MKGGVRQMKNIKGDYYRRGSVSMIAIMAILFFVVVLAAIMPMTNTETKFAAANRNDTEARYAAEAGAKRAISEMLAEQTSWGWLEGTKGATDKKQTFIDGKDYKYSVYIETADTSNPSYTSAPLTGKPVIGQQYKITSTGYVNGSKKVISVIYKMNAGGSIPTSAVYVKGNLSAHQSLEVTGDIVAGGTISNVTATGTMASNVQNMIIPSYDFEEYKKDAVQLPHIVHQSTTGGVKNYSLPKHTSNFTISPTGKTKYYVEGNLSIDENNLEITATHPAVIFVKNDLSIPSNSLKLTGHIMLISGGVDVSEYNSTNFSNIVIVSAGNVSFKNNTTIVGILAVGGDLYFKAGNTTVTGNENLAKEFNDLMGGYELGGGGGTTAGEAEITNWKIE